MARQRRWSRWGSSFAGIYGVLFLVAGAQALMQPSFSSLENQHLAGTLLTLPASLLLYPLLHAYIDWRAIAVAAVLINLALFYGLGKFSAWALKQVRGLLR